MDMETGYKKLRKTYGLDYQPNEILAGSDYPPDRSLIKLPRGYLNWAKWEYNEAIQPDITDPIKSENLTIYHLQEILEDNFDEAQILISQYDNGVPIWRELEFSVRCYWFQVCLCEEDFYRYLLLSHEFYPASDCGKLNREKFENITLGCGHKVDIKEAENQWGFTATFFDGYRLPDSIEIMPLLENISGIVEKIIALHCNAANLID